MAVRGGQVVYGLAAGAHACGAATLALDLTRAFGLEGTRDENLAEDLLAADSGEPAFDEVFLVSDEHGIVAATDCEGPVAERLRAGYDKLLDSMDQRR